MNNRKFLRHPALRALTGAATLVAAFALLSIPGVASAADKAAASTGGSIDTASCAKPVWPQSAIDAKRTGTVKLALLIGDDGKVKQTKITQSSGYQDLDQAASDGIAKCSFKPGLVDGKPMEAWVKMEYVWSLK